MTPTRWGGGGGWMGGCLGCCNSHWVWCGCGVDGVGVWDAVTHTGCGVDGGVWDAVTHTGCGVDGVWGGGML